MTLFTSRGFSGGIVEKLNETYLKLFLLPSPLPAAGKGQGRQKKLLGRKVVYPVPDLNEMKKFEDPLLTERLVSNYVAPGTRLKLRGDVCQQVKERDWIFNKVKDNMIFLVHETGAHGIVVGIEDIDWTGL